MGKFESHNKKLKDELLNLIHIKEMALPDFQRDFVWQPPQTKALLVSLARNFPAGSLLRMENKGGLFAPRAFASAPRLGRSKPKYLILDGQQRLTSLYLALYGSGEYLYYVDLATLMQRGNAATKGDIETAIFYEKRDKAKKTWTPRKQALERVLPLHVLFGGKGFHKWLNDIEGLVTNDKQYAIDRKNHGLLLDVYEHYIEPMVDYEFPVVTLTEDASLEAICTIFETLNSTGVKLSVFDLLSARYFAQNRNLRTLWDNAWRNSNYFEDFDLDPYYILQVIASQTKKSVKRSDVLELDSSDVVNKWSDAIWGMEQALELLYSDCGVLGIKWLSYNTILVPMASVFMANRHLKGPLVGNLRSKLKQWYWCSVFGQTYESNPTSQSIKDITELQTWIKGGHKHKPMTVRNFKFDRKSLFSTTTQQRAIYRGVICLVTSKPSRDFHSTKAITSSLIQSNRIDDHHIFPKAFLASRGMRQKKKVDTVLNRTLIDRETNRIIGKNAPSVYLKSIESQLTRGKLNRVLTSHYLPEGSRSSLRSNNYKRFLEERANAIYALILDVTS